MDDQLKGLRERAREKPPMNPDWAQLAWFEQVACDNRILLELIGGIQAGAREETGKLEGTVAELQGRVLHLTGENLHLLRQNLRYDAHVKRLGSKISALEKKIVTLEKRKKR